MGEAAEKLGGNSTPINRPWLKDHQWKPGVSGNQTGRPKDCDRLAQYIRENTKGGRDIADFMRKVMNGDEPGFKDLSRIRAGEWLADRGFGKAKEVAPMVEPFPTENLTDEELIVIQRILQRRSANGGSSPSGTDPAQAS